VIRWLALRCRNGGAIDGSPVSFAAFCRYSVMRANVDVRNEVLGVGTLEHEYSERIIGLGLLNEGDQITNQFWPQKVHGRGGDFRE
jgi:hypothetical protein